LARPGLDTLQTFLEVDRAPSLDAAVAAGHVLAVAGDSSAAAVDQIRSRRVAEQLRRSGRPDPHPLRR
jgi:hypothetical protein